MCSLFALWISTFLQNFITLCCLVFELRDLEEEEEEKDEGEDEQNSLIAPYTYDARHHANPYILSTTVLSDTLVGGMRCRQVHALCQLVAGYNTNSWHTLRC